MAVAQTHRLYTQTVHTDCTHRLYTDTQTHGRAHRPAFRWGRRQPEVPVEVCEHMDRLVLADDFADLLTKRFGDGVSDRDARQRDRETERGRGRGTERQRATEAEAGAEQQMETATPRHRQGQSNSQHTRDEQEPLSDSSPSSEAV